MNELTRERSYIHSSIVKSPLPTHQIARNMNELTQERSHMYASFVTSPLLGYQIANNMERDMPEPVL